MEASAGIEPACKDLQSSASPLRHEASLLLVQKRWRAFRMISKRVQERSDKNPSKNPEVPRNEPLTFFGSNSDREA